MILMLIMNSNCAVEDGGRAEGSEDKKAQRGRGRRVRGGQGGQIGLF